MIFTGHQGKSNTTKLKRANSDSECVCVSDSWENLECAFQVRRHRLARARQVLATRRERARETAEERAKNWAKSARQQKAQTLKILLLIHNDTAVLDIFKFLPHFHFLSLFDNISYSNCDCLCVRAVHTFKPLVFLKSFSYIDEQNALDYAMNHGGI